MEPKSRLHPDLKNLCHCCLIRAKHKDLKRSYRRNNQLEVFSDILTECFEIQLWAREEGEGGICEICLKKLRDASDFKRQVLSCQHQLEDAAKEEEEPEIKQEILDIDIDFEPLDDDVKTEPQDPEEQDTGTQDKKTPDNMTGTSRLGDVTVRITRELDIDSGGDNDVKMEQDRSEAQDSDMEQISTQESGSASVLGTVETPVAAVKSRGDRAKIRDSATKKPAIAEKKIAKKSPKKAPAPASTASASSEAVRSLNTSTTPSILESELTKKSPKTKAVVRPNRASASAEAVRAHEANVRTLIQHSNCTPFLTRTIAGIQCCHCRSNFLTLALLKEHMQSTHTPDQYRGIYKHSISTKVNCKMDTTDLECKLCEQKCDLLPDLKEHLIKEHDVKFIPEEKNFFVEFKLTDDGVMKCALCDSTFEVFKSLLLHMNCHYRNFVCNECDKGFINIHKLQIHQTSHETGTFTCTFCPKVFKSKVKQINHESYAHRRPRENRAKCPHCDQTFSEYYIRNKHIIAEHNTTAADYKCNICDKSFIIKKRLTYHIRRVHLMERNHKCTECGQNFFSKRLLKDHMIRHTGERIHKCTECNKAYARKKTLTEHMRIHNNDRRFKCELCGLAFVQNSTLKGHMSSKHGVALADSKKAELT